MSWRRMCSPSSRVGLPPATADRGLEVPECSPTGCRSSSLLLAGGWVMVAILGLSVLMWVLILDRYLFFFRAAAAAGSGCGHHLECRAERCIAAAEPAPAGIAHRLVSRPARQLADHHSGDHRGAAAAWSARHRRRGMIQTFEVMTVFGTGNVRGMADAAFPRR